jgi:CS domain
MVQALYVCFILGTVTKTWTDAVCRFFMRGVRGIRAVSEGFSSLKSNFVGSHWLRSRFLKIPGCTTSAHRFLAPSTEPTAKDTFETVQCREGFYQTQLTCVLSIFARNIDSSTVKVTFLPRQLDISFVFDGKKRYAAEIPLYEEIDPAESKYTVLSMKLEITMKKANSSSWPVLRPDPNVTERVTFGVDSKNNA